MAQLRRLLAAFSTVNKFRSSSLVLPRLLLRANASSKARSQFKCSSCGAAASKWEGKGKRVALSLDSSAFKWSFAGKCSACGSWGSLKEQSSEGKGPSNKPLFAPLHLVRSRFSRTLRPPAQPEIHNIGRCTLRTSSSKLRHREQRQVYPNWT